MKYEVHVMYTIDEYVNIGADSEEEAYEQIEDMLPPGADNIDVITCERVFRDDDA